MGKPAARLGDMHMCPMVTPGTPPIPHVGGPITGPGCPTVNIGGVPAAVMGDMCVCVGPPDTIILGSTGVFIGGKPAARVGDTTAHGGTITVGCPTVNIGEKGSGGGGGGGGAGAAAGGSSGAAGLSAMPVAVLKKIITSMPPKIQKKMAQIIAMKKAAVLGKPFAHNNNNCPICKKKYG